MKNKITIPVKEMDEKVLYLHTHIGDGSLGKIKFDADLRLPDSSIVVKVGGKRYLVSSQDIIKAVIEYYESNE